MEILYTVVQILFYTLQAFIAFFLLLPLLSLLTYGLLRLLRVKTPFERKPFITDKNFEFALIVTAHQEPDFVPPLVASILKQSYKHFQVYVVADDCDTSALHFADNRVKLLRPEQALHSKIKSIRYAMSALVRRHDAVIILDADNLLHPRFLEVMNQHFQKGYQVVQCDFQPKNTDTAFARMDAMGDMFNFFIEREMRMRLGLSSCIWGSGVAVNLDLYNEVEYTNMLGGFDKKLQAHLAQRVRRIAYTPDAILYDEKVSNGASLQTQRTRWISTYFTYAAESLALFKKGLLSFDFNLSYFGFVLLRPPLFIVLGLGVLFLCINTFVQPAAAWLWASVFVSFIISFAGIVVLKGKRWDYLYTIALLPLFVLRQMAALFQLKQAKKSFMKTKHTKVMYVEDLVR